MDIQTFLQTVLPSSGNYFGLAASPDGRLRQSKLQNLSALVKWAEANKTRRDTYFATGAFKDSRTAAQCTLKRALYVDLDCGPNKPYASKHDAVAALLQFCTAHFLRPSILVDSGYGVHAYWVFNADVKASRWLSMATLLKAVCESGGLKADPTVTADSARILRVPGTINHKHGSMAPVKVMYANPALYYAPTVVEKRLGAAPAVRLVVDNDDLSSGVRTDGPPMSAALVVERCPMFADAMATGGKGLPEHLWVKQLHALAYCESGEEYAHKISMGYEGYKQSETQAKWMHRVADKQRTGPTKCDTFAQTSPHCATCPHRGRITTPVQLGHAHRIDAGGLPYPFQQDERGVYLQVDSTDQDGNDIKVRQAVFGYKVRDFDVYYTEEGTFIRFVAENAGTAARVELNFSDTIDRKACTTQLSNCHAVLHYKEYIHFRDLMSAWVTKMQEAKLAKDTWSHLGWAKDMTAFVTAREVIFQDGRIQPNLSVDRRMTEMYTPKGAREAWIEAAHALTGKGRHENDMIISTAFGSPLMTMLRDPSAVVAVVSTKSGSGKTTSLEVAQAVWANPKTAMNQLDDTPASIIRRIAYANNLPVYWDEVRAKEEAIKYTKLMFQLTGGKERSRLTQSAELREMGTWNTILTVASNESIAEHATYASRDTEAGRARIFEVEVPAIDPSLWDPTMGAKMLKVYSNHGVIGREYGEWLVKNRDFVKKLVTAFHVKLCEKYQTDAVERFWLSTVAAIVIGNRLAKHLGYVLTDCNAFEAFMIRKFQEQRRDKAAAYGTEQEHAYDVLMDYIAANQSQIAAYEEMYEVNNTNGRIFSEPRFGEVVAAVALQTRTLRMARDPFRNWMYQKGIGSPKMVIEKVGGRELRGRIAPSGAGTIAPVVRAYDIQLPPGMVDAAPALFEES